MTITSSTYSWEKAGYWHKIDPSSSNVDDELTTSLIDSSCDIIFKSKVNNFFDNSEKINSSLYGTEKKTEIKISPSIEKKESSVANLSNNAKEDWLLESGEMSRSEMIEEAMSGLNAAICKDKQLLAFAELAKLLEDEKTKSLLGLALKEGYVHLIKLANARGWTLLTEILKCNANGLPVSANSVCNGSSNKIYNHNNAEIIKEKSTFLTPWADYPSFAADYDCCDLENKYLGFVKEAAKNKKTNKKVIKSLVQAYPLYTNEAKLIECLNNIDTKHKEYILRFFKELVRNGLTGQMQLNAPGELSALNQKFNTEKIMKAALEKSQPDSIKAQKPQTNSVDLIDWRFWNEEQFAEALAIRDSNLIHAIKLNDIMQWLNGKAPQADAVVKLEKTCETTVQWIAFQIVSELDGNNCLDIFDKFLKIGSILLKNKNLHSASQVARALTHPAVCRILPDSRLYCPGYLDLFTLSRSENVFLDHQDSQAGEVEGRLFPIDQTFWQGLQKNYINTDDFDELAGIARYAQALKNFRPVTPFEMGFQISSMCHFVSDLESISFEAIHELSRFFHDMECDLTCARGKLADWNSAGLAHFLLNGKKDAALVKRLFSQGICNGEKLLEEFSKNKDLIESGSWTYDMKLTIWAEYVSHLSARSLYESRQ